jgi:hypothetical protein
VEEAAAAATALVRLSPEPGGTVAWRDYHRRFLDRYGLGAVVPLPDLLHAGNGLGYPAGFRATRLSNPVTRSGASARTALLTRLAHDAAWNRQREVALTDADLDPLAGAAAHHRVLEIGTGTGYNAALLAHRLRRPTGG